MHTTTRLAGEASGNDPEGRSVRALLFERIMERIHRYFVKLVWDPHGVDDCLQRVLLRLEKSLQEGTYDPRQSFNRWMWIKAHSVYVDYCRERGRMPNALPDERVLPDAESVVEGVETRLDAEAVLEFLRENLSPEALEAFVLHYDEGHTITDIAAILGRARKTVRKRLEKARRVAGRMLEGKNP